MSAKKKAEAEAKATLRRKVQVALRAKTPTSASPHIGVEIECLIDAPTLDDDHPAAAALARADLERHVYVHYDGSIDEESSDEFGIEVCVLGSERRIAEIVRRVCTALRRRCKAHVNESCGLHVHLDMRGRDIRRAYTRLVSVQPLLYALVAPSRHRSEYCCPTVYRAPPTTRACQDWAVSVDRYFGINSAAFGRYHTLEVRIHQGSVNAKKINHWIRLLRAIICARSFPEGLPDPAGSAEQIGKKGWRDSARQIAEVLFAANVLPPSLRSYVEERLTTFAPRARSAGGAPARRLA